jgi:hypothetical protein
MDGRKAGDRPVDVAIVNQETGARLPCELSYQGLDEDGLHTWRIDSLFNPDTDKLTIGVFPPKTTLAFDMRGRR